MNIKYPLIILTLTLLVTNLPSYAGKIYRFIDKEGLATLSKVLPPYVAQQGYDIIDDKTHRLIERVPTLEESSKINAKERLLAEIKEKEEQEKRDLMIHNRSLIDRYPDDRVIINARDADLAFLKKQMSEVTAHKTASEQNIQNLQQQAAEQELNGETVSPMLKKRLSRAQQDIVEDQLHFERLEDEYSHKEAAYNKDLAQLRELLGINAPEAKEATNASVP